MIYVYNIVIQLFGMIQVKPDDTPNYWGWGCDLGLHWIAVCQSGRAQVVWLLPEITC